MKHGDYLTLLTRMGLFLLLLPAGLSFALAEEIHVGSWDEAWKLAQARNLRLRESEQRVEEARQALLRTRSLFLPRAQVSSGFTQKGFSFSIPAAFFQNLPKDPGLFTGYKSEWSMRLQVEQPLFTGGRNWNSYQLSQNDLALQERSYELRRMNLEVEVTRGYYSTLLAQHIWRIKQELIEQSKRHQREVEKRLSAGDASRFEKLRADVQLANLYPELIRSRNAIEIAMAQFKNVLGALPEDTLTVTGSMECVPQKPNLPESLRTAPERRPELKISQLLKDSAERSRKLNRAGFFPLIGAFYSQDFRSNSLDTLYDQRHRNWMVGLSLNLALFEGGRSYYQAKEDRFRLEQARLREEQTRRDIQVEVLQAALEVERTIEVIASQKQTVAQAEEALRIAEVSYANGVITHLELMDTQLALDQAKINFITAQYDYLIGTALFRKAVAEHQ